MTRLHLNKLYDRGLKSFASLSPLERDAFVLHDLDIYYEMECGFEDYLLSGGHDAELAWLADTLERIGDAASSSLIAQLRQMDDSRRNEMEALCDSYYELRVMRWDLLKRYLTQQSAELTED